MKVLFLWTDRGQDCGAKFQEVSLEVGEALELVGIIQLALDDVRIVCGVVWSIGVHC